jgi:hypothetical protein
MEITYATRPASDDVPNDDYVLAAETWAVMLDGATAPAGVDSGCIHDVPWLTAHLATHQAAMLATEPERELRDVLRESIVRTCADHADTCDVTNRDSPSSTSVLVRVRGGRFEYAVLGDSGVVIEHADGTVEAVVDDRTSYLPSYTREDVSLLRNSDQGFWIASIKPEAADRALTGSVPAADVARVAVVTDGATRLNERYGWSWKQLLDRLDEDGPDAVIDAVRREDAQVPKGVHRGKYPHDDISVLLWRLSGGAQ